MTVPRLSEAAIRQQATAESFRRGEDYYRRGAVVSVMQRGNVLQAEVEGSQYEPYRVRVTFDEGGITSAVCDCPYDWGGWCKHIVATLARRQVGPAPALSSFGPVFGLLRRRWKPKLVSVVAAPTSIVRVRPQACPGRQQDFGEPSA